MIVELGVLLHWPPAAAWDITVSDALTWAAALERIRKKGR